MIRWAIAFALLCQPVMADDLVVTPHWEYVADTVMGGVSSGQVTQDVVDGRAAARLTGLVSLDNNGGFIQMAFDLAGGAVFDASGYSGIALTVQGNGDTYDVRLRTDALTRPWQSFRTSFSAPEVWTKLHIPFDTFEPHRTDASFDPGRLRRIGILAIGREMHADIAVSSVEFYH